MAFHASFKKRLKKTKNINALPLFMVMALLVFAAILFKPGDLSLAATSLFSRHKQPSYRELQNRGVATSWRPSISANLGMPTSATSIGTAPPRVGEGAVDLSPGYRGLVGQPSNSPDGSLLASAPFAAANFTVLLPAAASPAEQDSQSLADRLAERPAEAQVVTIPANWQLDEPFVRQANEVAAWKAKANAQWQAWGVLPQEADDDAPNDDVAGDPLARDRSELESSDQGDEPGIEPTGAECQKVNPFQGLRLLSYQPGLEKSGQPLPLLDLPTLLRKVSGAPDFFGPGTDGWEGSPADVASRDPNFDPTQVSTNEVLSLGKEGEVIFAVIGGYLQDEPGADLTIFENPYKRDSTHVEDPQLKKWVERAKYFVELGVVSVAASLTEGFVELPCNLAGEIWYDAQSGERRNYFMGCAGNMPVRGGGDPIDLSAAGHQLPDKVRFIKIRDSGTNVPSEYNDGDKAGFDLDAIAVISSICKESTP